MPELTLQFVLSQIAGAIALVCLFIQFQQKTKVKILIWNSISLGVIVVMFSLLEYWLVVVTLLLAITSNLLLFYFDRNEERLAKWKRYSVLGCVVIAIITAGVLTQSLWYDWILMSASVGINLSLWFSRMYLFRLFIVVYASTLLGHNIANLIIMGILLECTTLVSNAIYFIRKFSKKRRGDDEEIMVVQS